MFLIQKLFLFVFSVTLFTFCFTSCEGIDDSPKPEERGMSITDEGTHLSIITFNNDVRAVKKFTIIKQDKINEFFNFIDAMSLDTGSALYHAEDYALDNMIFSKYLESLDGVTLLTFTDDIDSGSQSLNQNYTTSSDYLAAIKNKLTSTTLRDININAYGIGLKKADGSVDANYETLIRDLSSSDANKIMLPKITDMKETFGNIATDLKTKKLSQTVSIKVINRGDGTKVRIIFDGLDAKSTQIYIEGTLQNQGTVLENVIYKGATSSSGTTVNSVSVSGISSSFVFKKYRRVDDVISGVTGLAHNLGGTWKMDPDFKPSADANTKMERIVIATMVLDLSGSLDEAGLEAVKEAAKYFIEIVLSYERIPETPTNVTGNWKTRESIALSWPAVHGATSYKLYIANSATPVDLTSAAYTDNSATVGKVYEVSAVNSYGESPKFSFTAPDYPVPATPTNIVGNWEALNKIVLSWDAVPGAVLYKLYTTDSATPIEVTTPEYTDDKAAVGKVYQITALNIFAESPKASYTTTDYPIPSKPVVVGDSWEGTLVWENVEGIVYDVYRSNVYTEVFNSTPVKRDITTNSYKDESRDTGSYYYCVVAKNKFGKKAQSITVKLTFPIPLIKADPLVTGELIEYKELIIYSYKSLTAGDATIYCTDTGTGTVDVRITVYKQDKTTIQELENFDIGLNKNAVIRMAAGEIIYIYVRSTVPGRMGTFQIRAN